jgi:hypothetical protein
MSIASEITRISGNIADAYTSLDAKGATMPAAGSQNSANLADTIDSIPAGGGESNADFETIKGIINNYSGTSSQLPSDWEAGTTTTTYKYVIGYVIPKSFDKVYLPNKPNGYKIPSTATYTLETLGNTTKAAISFNGTNNEHWVCIAHSSDVAANFPGLIESGNTYIDGDFFPVEYIAAKTNLDTKWKFGLLRNYSICNLPLKDVYLGENTFFDENFSTTLVGNIETFLYALGYFNNPDWFFDNSEDISKGDAIPDSMVASNTPVSFNRMIGITSNFPFVLDCSTSTFSGTLKLLDSKDNNNLLFNIKIKLPTPTGSTNKITFATAGSPLTGAHTPLFTIESLEYMAEYAPTITANATLQLGWQNIQTAGGASGTIISALTNKGWTVT